MARIPASLRRLPVGLLGEHRNTSFTAGVQRASTPLTSSAKPSLARSGTSSSRAPWMRAGAAEAAYQQVDRLIAAAADQQRVRRNPVQAREPFDERPRLRLGIAVEAGA